MDESSPQTTANTQRLWSFGKPIFHKNTNRMKANAFGCYMLNGTSVIDFKEHSKKEDVGEFLKTITVLSKFFVWIVTFIDQISFQHTQSMLVSSLY